MANIIDLPKIFNQTWGFIGLPFPEIVIKSIPTRSQTTFVGEIFNDMRPRSVIGNEHDISSQGVKFRTRVNGDIIAFLPIWLSETDRNALEYLLPNTHLSMTSKKTIIKTPLVNRDGTVKEQITMEDWDIRIRGVLVSKDDNYPEEEKQMLVNWYKNKKAMNIQNVKTSICLEGREKVIIEALSFPEIRGFENTQPYEMQLCSDVEFSLYLT